MAAITKIQWADSVINFWSGCTKKGAPRKWHESAIKQAFSLNRKPWMCDNCGESRPDFDGKPSNDWCQNCGDYSPFHHRRIFVNSMSDWLDDEVPIEWLARMLDTIRQCPDVDFILCTKRPENFDSRMLDCMNSLGGKHGNEAAQWLHGWKSGAQVPHNIILLASVENQAMADKRIPELLRIPARVRGLSCEPLLGAVDLRLRLPKLGESPWPAWNLYNGEHLHWLTCGGESGKGAKPCDVNWIRSLIKQGKAAGVPVFVKQIGACWMSQIHDDERDFKAEVKHPKGGDMAEWPEDLRVREFYE